MSAPLQGAAGSPVCPPEWLAVREPADAEARSADLAAALCDALPEGPLVVRDLGCGTGSMARWLAPHLRAHGAGDQHWILHDRDPVLLDRALAGLPGGVTGEARHGDLTALDAAELAGTSLVTASALLDLLTAGEIDDLADACTRAGCPALLTLSVTGEVRFDPAGPADRDVAAAFDDHQRRETGGRVLLGPDAAGYTVAAFRRRGALVRTAATPWRLGPDRPELTREWLAGWYDAARAQRPELRAAVEDHRERRYRELAAGRLTVAVGHSDLLVLPAGTGGPGPRA
ncbi:MULTISPECIES: class I SAM-dependent methyltransferase [unclassified Pseudonocardia]|uniref:class I SAM-dependent methyltransferase n=1 Tax=unclassified Pseudonocardia TaxID=2619320 RepID=UPI000A8EF524|nr:MULTISPECIES: class I SAM-dependent methyltransferase [unclassified Pseudonocardia]